MSSRERGIEIEIRPLRAADEEAYLLALSGLSSRTMYQRFAGPKKQFSDSEIADFLDVGDAGRDALLAVDPASGEVLGVGRFAPNRDQPGAAEVAFVVGDKWQGRGVGKALAAAVCSLALARGFRRLTATSLVDNSPATRLLAGQGFRPVSASYGVREWVAEPAPPVEPS